MKNKYNLLLLGFILVIGIIFGDMVRLTYFPIETTKKEVVFLTDNLPLANQGSIKIELVDGRKLVIFSLEDLKYVTKKKRVIRQTIKNLESLFKRF